VQGRFAHETSCASFAKVFISAQRIQQAMQQLKHQQPSLLTTSTHKHVSADSKSLSGSTLFHGKGLNETGLNDYLLR
jgi:hypothetical protein